MRNQESRKYGAGPWTFDGSRGKIPDLQPGDHARLDFLNMTYNQRPGYFREFLPMQDLQVTNKSDSNPVKVTVNDQYEARVPANQIETFPSTEAMQVEIYNAGGSVIEQGKVVVEVSEGGYDADAAAREEKFQHPLMKIGKSVIGL